MHVFLALLAMFSLLYFHRAKLPWLHLATPRRRGTTDTDQQQSEIEYLPPKPPVKDILGGAGSYAALGARLFSPAPDLSKTVAWIIDQGSDFPEPLTTLISSWQTSADFRLDASRLTTRAWNGYADESETRAFRYTTPKKRLVAADLSPPLVQSRVFHLCCSPSRCRELVAELVARRKDETPEGETYCRPIVIWEPVPDLCVPDELLNLTNCLPHVDVCSPNHAELAGFMGDSGLDPETGEISTAAVERSCEQLLGSMPLQNYSLVIRAGEKGCYVAKNGGRKRASSGTKGTKRRRKDLGGAHHGTLQPETDMFSFFADMLQDDEGVIAREEIEVDPGVERWIPAYFQKEDKERVVDPTGGGNTFLGGMAIALARNKGVEEAATWGSIAASFAIEQVGVPILAENDESEETWNGVRVDDRLQEFHDRIGWVAN